MSPRENALRTIRFDNLKGYFCCPDQGLPFPEEHVRAFHEAVERFGVYVR